MKKRGEVSVALLMFGVLLVVVLGIIFAITSTSSASEHPLPTPDSECKTLYYNGENAINLVFFADEAGTKKYMDHLLATDPYTQFPNSFNAYYIDQEVECEEYKGIAILCHSKDLVKEAGACPNDFIVVLNEAGNLRSSAYQGVASINTNHPLSVFTHEMGHVLLSLDEEYLGAKPHIDSVNCKESCDEFTNSEGCFAGCSEGDLYRSIDNGVMRTLSTNEYGTHSEQAISEWIAENTGNSPSTITGYQIAEDQIATCLQKTYRYLEIDQKTKTEVKALHIGCYPGRNPRAPNTAAIIKDGAFVDERLYPSYIYTAAPGEKTEEINDGVDGVFPLEKVTFTFSEEILADELQLFNERGELTYTTTLEDIGRSPCII